MILELFNDDSINCLLHSIRVEDIIKAFSAETCYKKVYVSDKANIDFAQITALPSLVFMKGDTVLKVVSGYYEDTEKETLFKLIKNINL